ncbi:hypothetical protein ACHHYP_05723 [Achlya hypogyna]|uniref:Uncharacterized protein n=1 Tax=Achlya hypogyna TaxID=1202772 RepID=A0A1V9YWZ6_ACHHY|nr:hypothetical protein ACHHYP_05723 [Achlya hypogyna]
MEPTAKYALYHATEPSALKWVAKIRLTPELLAKLQDGAAVEELTLQFAVDKTEPSVLRVGDESFELLTYPEDASVNHLCTLAPEDDGNGYAFHETGRIAKKLIVQRLLDGQEKDRLKDRHARSVVDSKARSSKLLDDKPTRADRKRTRTVVWSPETPAAATSAKASATFPSALTPEQLDNIAHGIAKILETPPKPPPVKVVKPALPKRAKTADKPKLAVMAKTPEKTPYNAMSEGVALAPVDEHPPANVEHEAPEAAPEPKGGEDSGSQAALAKTVLEGPKQIRAKRRVLSPALRSLSTFSVEMEGIFKNYSSIRPPASEIASAEELAASELTRAEYLAVWTHLEKAHSIEFVLTHTKALTGEHPNPKYAIKPELREEGIAVLKAMMDQLSVMITALDVAMSQYKKACGAANDDTTE